MSENLPKKIIEIGITSARRQSSGPHFSGTAGTFRCPAGRPPRCYTQHHPEDPAPLGPTSLVIMGRRTQSEVHLHLLTRLELYAPNPSRLRLLELAHKALHRPLEITESVLLNQILINALGAQAHLHLTSNLLGHQHALFHSSTGFSDGRNCRTYQLTRE